MNQGEGKTGRVNASESSGNTSRVETAEAVADIHSRMAERAVQLRCAQRSSQYLDLRIPDGPEQRGDPPLSSLMAVERGNPAVRLGRPSKPSASKTQCDGGHRMTQEAKAGSRKAAGTPRKSRG
jgi:hypothetical protein